MVVIKLAIHWQVFLIRLTASQINLFRFGNYVYVYLYIMCIIFHQQMTKYIMQIQLHLVSIIKYLSLFIIQGIDYWELSDKFRQLLEYKVEWSVCNLSEIPCIATLKSTIYSFHSTSVSLFYFHIFQWYWSNCKNTK